jgi:hypothetical protein
MKRVMLGLGCAQPAQGMRVGADRSGIRGEPFSRVGEEIPRVSDQNEAFSIAK